MPEFLLLQMDEINRAPIGTTYRNDPISLTGAEILERLREAYPLASISGIILDQKDLILDLDADGEFRALRVGDVELDEAVRRLPDQPDGTIE